MFLASRGSVRMQKLNEMRLNLYKMKNYRTGIFFLFFLMALNVQAQDEQVANLRFEAQETVDCNNNPAICYKMQLNALPGEQFEFFSMNVRMFYDSARMKYVQTIPTLASDPFPGAYTYTMATQEVPSAVDLGMTSPIYLRFNITGIAVGAITKDITPTPTTIAELCFSVDGDIESVMEVCEPLVWDLQQDGSGGFQAANDGVVLLTIEEASPGVWIPTALDETVEQYNWAYDLVNGNVSGEPLAPADAICIDIPCAPLAVELSQFNASRSGAKQAKLYWVTESEMNNEYFSVQRSKDGIEFEEIGVVKGNGTTSARHAYDMYDNDPYLGINYYRLIQYDFDGTSASSGIRTVTFEDPNRKGLTVTAQPNPFVKSLRVDYEVEGQSQMIVYDAEGTLINTFDFDGRVRHEIDLEGYPAGMYVVKVINGEDEQVVKVMKAN